MHDDYRDYGWCYTSPGNISFSSAWQTGSLDPIREWTNWRLFLSLCEDQSITDLSLSSAITLQGSILKAWEFLGISSPW